MTRATMTFRVLSSHDHPLRLIEHIRLSGCIARQAQTAYRGPLAIVSGGQVHAVATLREVKPIAAKTESGFLWCIDELREITLIPCAMYGTAIGAEATFMNGDRLEPQFLNAGAQEELNRLLIPVEEEEAPEEQALEEQDSPLSRAEEDEKNSDTRRPMPPDYLVEKLIETPDSSGQLGLF